MHISVGFSFCERFSCSIFCRCRCRCRCAFGFISVFFSSYVCAICFALNIQHFLLHLASQVAHFGFTFSGWGSVFVRANSSGGLFLIKTTMQCQSHTSVRHLTRFSPTFSTPPGRPLPPDGDAGSHIISHSPSDWVTCCCCYNCCMLLVSLPFLLLLCFTFALTISFYPLFVSVPLALGLALTLTLARVFCFGLCSLACVFCVKSDKWNMLFQLHFQFSRWMQFQLDIANGQVTSQSMDGMVVKNGGISNIHPLNWSKWTLSHRNSLNWHWNKMNSSFIVCSSY